MLAGNALRQGLPQGFDATNGGCCSVKTAAARGPEQTIGLLAWPTRKALYLVDLLGVVSRSDDGGRNWRRVGDIGGEPAAFMATGDRELDVALPDGTIRRSTDGGTSWTVRSSPP